MATEPPNIVLEQLRQMRAENATRHTELTSRLDTIAERLGLLESAHAAARQVAGNDAEMISLNLRVTERLEAAQTDLLRRVTALEAKAS
jgi:hypothetical protein